MNGLEAFDPRELSDRDLFRYILFGDLARPGWSGRRLAIARRLVVLAFIAMLVLVAVAVLRFGVIVVWAVAS